MLAQGSLKFLLSTAVARVGKFINYISFSELSVAKRLQEGGFRLVVGRAGLVTNSGYFPHMSMIVKVKLYLLSHRVAPIHPN